MVNELMSDLVELKPEDMTLEEAERLGDYIKNGLPGIQKVMESDIFKWFELYMVGRTYSEIAEITKAPKDKVLYMSYKQKWHEKRMRHYNDILNNIAGKLTKTKLSSINTVATIITALNKFYGKKFNKYLANNDESILESLDTKLLTHYYKSMDIIEKLSSAGKVVDPQDEASKHPMVNINMMGGTVKQIDPQTLEITEDNAGEFLKALAGAKKKQNDEV